MSYYTDARDDAKSMVPEFADQILEQLLDKEKASDDLNNDYSGGDSYHHENHVDKAYTLSEAAELLDELSDYEETDTGLWDGLEPRRTISVQAAYTYGNAVMEFWRELIEQINDAAADVLTDLEAKYIDEDSDRQDAIEERRNELQERIAEAEEAGASEDELLALDDELEAIEDNDPSEYEEARDAERRAALQGVIEDATTD